MFTTRGSVDFMALTGSDEKQWADASGAVADCTSKRGVRRIKNLVQQPSKG
ncbi:hypothetical protein PpBr36_01306 [Pyricularia pennisetigena]|uniref:hypothetical protein n=1 Tax=Pyricularia pennisetigena TaxID=1578925 RepID=UPI00114FF481|nr:hypothetical protein PpBr36_01306 [Pyricularia pennisetigena]TLS29379.1 hypothetical protein PpBr36_01306 [Pyricularia pennisetigena]